MAVHDCTQHSLRHRLVRVGARSNRACCHQHLNVPQLGGANLLAMHSHSGHLPGCGPTRRMKPLAHSTVNMSGYHRIVHEGDIRRQGACLLKLLARPHTPAVLEHIARSTVERCSKSNFSRVHIRTSIYPPALASPSGRVCRSYPFNFVLWLVMHIDQLPHRTLRNQCSNCTPGAHHYYRDHFATSAKVSMRCSKPSDRPFNVHAGSSRGSNHIGHVGALDLMDQS